MFSLGKDKDTCKIGSLSAAGEEIVIKKRYYVKGDEDKLKVSSRTYFKYDFLNKPVSFDSQDDADKYGAMRDQKDAEIQQCCDDYNRQVSLRVKLQHEVDSVKAKRKAKKKQKRLDKQEAEFREFLTLGQKFTHLGIKHVVRSIGCDRVDIHRKGDSLWIDSYYYEDIEFLRAITKK